MITDERRSIWTQLYHGETTFRIVERSRTWFVISGVVILAGLISLGVQGLNLGIEFRSGAVWDVPSATATEDQLLGTLSEFGVDTGRVQVLGEGADRVVRVQGPSLGFDTEQRIANRLGEVAGLQQGDVSLTSVGPSWGREITRKAGIALVVFLLAITLYVTLRFELKMALATLAALFHDIFVTVGIFSLFRFEVTPGTVIAFLTILGYSIYDGIVVFDKVEENTRLVSSTNRMTYSAMVDLSLNQTLMRSLNTQISAVLPMASLLFIGSIALGAHAIQEFSLALVIGQVSGAYSSLFIASPALAILKEREPRFRDVARRIDARGPVAEADAPVEADGEVADQVVRPSAPSTIGAPTGVIPPRPRKKTKRK